MTTDSHDNKLYKQQIVRIIVSPICCWLLRLASKEPEYAVFVRAFLFGGQPTFARLERKIRPHKRLVFASMTVSKCREKPCGGDFSLHPQDSTLQVSKGYRHTFARPITVSGLCMRLFIRCRHTFYLSDRLSADYCSQ